MAGATDILDTKSISAFIKNDTSGNNLFLFYGEEEYFLELAIKALKKKYLGEGADSMDFVKLDFSDGKFDLAKVEDNILIPAWMSEKRIVVVNNAEIFSISDPDKTFSESLKKLLSSVPDSCVLIFTETSIDKRKKAILKAFGDSGKIAEFSFMDDISLAKWIDKRFVKDGISITDSACTGIIERCEHSMRRIVSETDKLCLYCSSSDCTSIGDELIEQLCPPDIRGSVFTITDAIGENNCAKALLVLDKLLVLKEPCQKIRFMFSRHIRQLICAKDTPNDKDLIKKLGCHPFVAGKLVKQERNFSMEKLLSLYNDCCDKDYKIKSGKAEERQALESLICSAFIK